LSVDRLIISGGIISTTINGGKMTNPFDKKEKKFSICTPVYKEAWKTFGKFFRCLNESDYKTFEVIISFDGENPKGARELSKIIRKYPDMDIKFCVQEWGGAPKARNAAASIAKGDYLVFLDPDIYLYTDSMRDWANSFDGYDVVWGTYDIEHVEQKLTIGQDVPVNAKDEPLYWAFRFSNYCSGAMPVRKSAFVGWDETVKSLQDWDMWQRMLLLDGFEGKKFKFKRRSYFMTDPPREGGISMDSNDNWIDRVKYIREKNGIPIADVCVCSLGAPYHGVNVAKTLGYDYLPMPSFKPNNYKAIYLLGFYVNGVEGHMRALANSKKKIVHWIGTDIYQLGHTLSVSTWRDLLKYFKEEKIIHLSEADFTQKELKALGIKSRVVPIPPSKLYNRMPLPKKFTVGIYENATQNAYKEELMQHVARSMPDIEFKFFGDETKKGKYDNVEHLGWIDMDEWMPKLSCNLRITDHDGLSLTVLQFLTAGRNVVTNTPVTGTIQVEPTRKSIIKGVRMAHERLLDPRVSERWSRQLSIDRFKRSVRRLV
jgi:glycosyltransferase involved in cell wall biosynthesis